MNFAAWAMLGLAFGVSEVVYPGRFLIFPAIGALIIALGGALVAGTPWLAYIAPPSIQLGSFLALSTFGATLFALPYGALGRRTPLTLVSAPTRLVGAVGTVVSGGGVTELGRVRLSDTLWPARLSATAPAAARGDIVRVVAVEESIVIVEPLFEGKSADPSELPLVTFSSFPTVLDDTDLARRLPMRSI